nr:hypothetical protein [Tanacetum cinerariifolium]
MYRGEMDERYKSTKLAKRGVINYGLPIPDTLLNDTIQEMDAYKEAEGVRRIGRKRPMRRGEGRVPEPAELHSTKIILKRKLAPKENTPSKDKPVKESELERIEREKRMIDEEINDDLDDTLEAIKTQKLKGKGSAARNETQDDKDSLDSNKTLSTPRLEKVVDEGDEDDALNLRSSRKEIPSGDSVDPDWLLVCKRSLYQSTRKYLRWLDRHRDEYTGYAWTTRSNAKDRFNEMTIAMSNDMDWALDHGLEVDSKEPLPLIGPQLNKRIPLEHFFNKDLEYLKTGNKDEREESMHFLSPNAMLLNTRLDGLMKTLADSS